MSIARIKDQLGLSRKATSPETPEADPRDAAIERLERELGEEQAHVTQLRRNVDELHFKIEILEKSYAKQLQDTRQRAEAAATALAEHQARLGELDGTHQETAKSLTEMREELERITAERDRLRRALDPATSRAVGTPGAQPPAGQARGEPMSIDDILEDAVWAREQERINQERGVAHGREAADVDGTVEELIPADLVFAGKDGSEEP